MTKLNSNTPTGDIEKRWDKHLVELSLIAPQNRAKYNIIVIGTGLAGASLCATLGESGYNVQSFCFNDSPRRAHSIAAQGGINASKNYQNDGDSTQRLFYDTMKGGDFRARESNVYRLAQLSGNIIDQAVSQGVPFAREYSGYLANRSFGGAQVSRTFYARGQTGQQLLLGAYSAMSKEIASGKVKHHSRCEMQEVILVDGKARGIVVRDLASGEISAHTADCVVMCTGGYSNAFYLSTNAKGCNTSATWRAHKKGAYFANPSFTQIHPTCIPPTGENQSKLTLMSESLRNDGRIWTPKKVEDCNKDPREIPEEDRDYFLERMYPAFANLVPRDVASRAVKSICDEGRGIASEINGGLADGYFIAPRTVASYLAKNQFEPIGLDHPAVVQTLNEVKKRISKLMNAPEPKHSPDYYHKKVGQILWGACGIAREREALKSAIEEIAKLHIDFWQHIKVTGVDNEMNQTLERAGRVADFIELGQLMCRDALEREESCGCHARMEHLAEDGEAKRDDDNFAYVAAWEYSEEGEILNKELLDFEFVKPSVRDYT